MLYRYLTHFRTYFSECKGNWECVDATESNGINFNLSYYWLINWRNQCSEENSNSTLCQMNGVDVCQLYPERCACDYEGKKYGDGNFIENGCSTCLCMSGNWFCTATQCQIRGSQIENGTNIGVNLTQTIVSIQCEGGANALGQITLPNTCTIAQNESTSNNPNPSNTPNSSNNSLIDNSTSTLDWGDIIDIFGDLFGSN